MIPRMPSSWMYRVVVRVGAWAAAHVLTSGWSNWSKKVNIDSSRLAEITAVHGAPDPGRCQAARSGRRRAHRRRKIGAEKIPEYNTACQGVKNVSSLARCRWAQESR